MKKRLVCLILAALLGLSLFACNNDDVPSGSSEGSAEQSDDVSETVSDDGSAAIAAEEAAKIDAMLSGGVPDRTLNRKNELIGLPYKLSRTAGSGDDYADPDGTKLTDGNYAEAFNTYTWTGFAGQKILLIPRVPGKARRGSGCHPPNFRAQRSGSEISYLTPTASSQSPYGTASP